MPLIEPFIALLVTIGVGFVCSRKKILKQAHIEGFETFIFKIAMPAYLFVSTLKYDLKILLNLEYTAGFLLSFLILAVISAIVYRKTHTLSALYMRVLAASYTNTAIYTLPIIVFLLNNPTAGILGNILQVIVIQPIFIILLNVACHKEKTIARKLIGAVSTPIIIMPILGMLCNYLQIHIPTLIIASAESLGDGSSTIALFTFGLTLGIMKLKRADFDRPLFMTILLKNIVHPVIAFILGKYILGLEDYWLYSLVIASSAPTAFIVYFIANQFSSEQALVKKTVAVSSVCSLASLVVIIYLLRI